MADYGALHCAFFDLILIVIFIYSIVIYGSYIKNINGNCHITMMVVISNLV